jgi:hypothetical protein
MDELGKKDTVTNKVSDKIVIVEILLLLLPIALQPFQFGLGFPYN